MKIDLTIQSIHSWLKPIHTPLLIAGPCSAETEQQLLTTAHLLAQTGKVSVLRAGIWKPRTRPSDFEGVGSIGLEWLKRAKLETGLLTTVEVANAKHVEKALAANVDILWIGSRSTANPFTVQEIAHALRGIDIPVMVKNPINPDLSLWIGALERINNSGITKLIAIHRGVSSFEKMAFRNYPMWEIVIKLKSFCPELPVLNDPSHICGNRKLIPYIAQKALDLGMQGFMIESHFDPSLAWTDSQQQLRPADLSKLIDMLTINTVEPDNQIFTDQLAELKQKLDKIDNQLIQKITERMQVTQKISEFKANNTALQINHWDEILYKRNILAQILKMNTSFINKLLELIHEESLQKQTEITNKTYSNLK